MVTEEGLPRYRSWLLLPWCDGVRPSALRDCVLDLRARLGSLSGERHYAPPATDLWRTGLIICENVQPSWQGLRRRALTDYRGVRRVMASVDQLF